MFCTFSKSDVPRYIEYVSRETYVPQSSVPRGTKAMLLSANVLACGTPVEHSSWEGLFPIVPGGLTCDGLSRVG